MPETNHSLDKSQTKIKNSYKKREGFITFYRMSEIFGDPCADIRKGVLVKYKTDCVDCTNI